MANRNRLLAKILLPLMSLGLFILVFELGILLVVGEQAKFPRHVVGTEFGVRVNQPDTTYRHKSADGTWWFTINSRGLRSDREYTYEKPAGVVRIISLGDSFTAGYEVSEEEIFSSVLRRNLQDAGLEVEVLNAGVSGYSNAEALLYLERELLQYDPDLVILSFYGNDLVDNVRSGLFQVVDGQLRQTADRYVPAGGLGDFLNTNPVFNWLAGYSNSFVFAKERLTQLLKRQIETRNRELVEQAASGGDSRDDLGDAPSESGEATENSETVLAIAILDRLYEDTHARGIPLIIQSIPVLVGYEDRELVEAFPLESFDVDREGLYFVGLKEDLSTSLGDELLYNRHSHGHWTAFSHRISGDLLSQVVLGENLLQRPVPGS